MYSLTVHYPNDVIDTFGRYLSHEGLIFCNGKYPIRIEDFVFLYIALCERLCLTVLASDLVRGECISLALLREKVVEKRNSSPSRYYLLSKSALVGGIVELDPDRTSYNDVLAQALGGRDLGDVTFGSMKAGTCFLEKDIKDLYSFVKNAKYVAFYENAPKIEGEVCCDSITTGDWSKCKSYYYDNAEGVKSEPCSDMSDKQKGADRLAGCISVTRTATKSVYDVYKYKEDRGDGYSLCELAGSGLESCSTSTHVDRPMKGDSEEDWCETKIKVTLPEPLSSKAVGFRIVWSVRIRTYEYPNGKDEYRDFIVPDEKVYDGCSAVVSTEKLYDFSDYISDLIPSEKYILDSIDYPSTNPSKERVFKEYPYVISTRASKSVNWESVDVYPIVISEIKWNTYFEEVG